jgi:hypothetical protein
MRGQGTNVARRWLIAGLWALSPVAQAAGTLVVRSDPPGQAILLDGEDVGLSTPATLTSLPAGRHVVAVQGACSTGAVVVDLPDNSSVTVVVPVERVPGRLRVEASPAGAKVELDGQPFAAAAGQAVAVPCGPHTVGITLPGYMPFLMNVVVDAGQELSLPITLERLGGGRLALLTEPADARVFIDGAPWAPATKPGDVGVGVHRLRVEADGHLPVERELVVEDKALLDLTIRLEKAPTVGRAAPAGGGGGGGMKPTRIAGLGLSGVGLILGGVAVKELSDMGAAADVYYARVDDVKATNDASVLPPAYANDYRTNTLLPQRNRAVGLSAAAAVALGAGLTLTFAF